MARDVTAVLADYIAEARPSDLSETLRHEAKRALLNHLAAALAGCSDPAIDRLLAVLTPLSGPRHATVIGRSERLDLLNAAGANAAIANVLDFCDTHMATVIHPTAPIAPPLFALAETRGLDGAALLGAFALGVDVACRIGKAISPGHYARGWHITGTCGVIGAAVAAGKAIGLDRDGLVAAIGCAATQASGLVETLGFDAKSLNVANAARNGLIAALLAERGFTGPARPIEGDRGFLAVLGSDADLAVVTDGLGSRSELDGLAYKPYPCGVVLHPVIDACLEIRDRVGSRMQEVDRVEVHGSALLKARADRQVSTGREAQVCLGHTVAVAMLRGRAGVAEYTDASVNDPAIREFGRRVVMVVDDRIAIEAATVTATLRDGTAFRADVRHGRGSAGRPLSDAEIEAKMTELASARLAPQTIRRLIETIWTLDTLADAAEPVRLASAVSPVAQSAMIG